MIYESRAGAHVVLLEIDNPPRNTFGREMRAQLREGLTRLAGDPSVRTVVLAGRGKAFCSGDDLREEFEAIAGGGQPGANLVDFGLLLEQLEAFRAPVIGAINGWCVGGGVELALCCDLRLASTEARFLCAGVNIGLAASAYRLPRLIGVANAKHMLFTGAPFDSAAAERFGLVNEVHSPDKLLAAALQLADRVASRAPLAVEASKRLATQASRLTPQEALDAQAHELAVLIGTEDHREGVQAFLEKRPATFERR